LPLHGITPWLLNLGLVTMLAAAGLAWHECVLLAVAMAAALRAFLWRMDVAAPWEAWRAGVRCLSAGLAGLLAAGGLCVLVVTGLLGLWVIRHDHGAMAVGLMTAAAVVFVGVQSSGARRWAEARFWVLLVGAAAFSLIAVDAGYALLPCLVAGGTALWLAVSSWRLARQCGELFRVGQRW
jgi:hypothetical protein